MDVWHVTQVLDDAMDGDKADPAEVSRAAWAVFATIPANPFYQQYMAALTGVLILALHKWQGANEMEAAGEADERTYCARAGFYDVVLFVCHLCGIPDPGRNCIRLYGETFADYIAEFRGAA